MAKTQQIEVGGGKYTLTSNRSLLMKLARLIPDIMKINQDIPEDEKENLQFNVGASIYDHMDVLFYEMIKVAHPNIDKEKSDKIYNAFCDEYNDVDENLIKFITSSFTGGIPRENKKNLNW